MIRRRVVWLGVLLTVGVTASEGLAWESVRKWDAHVVGYRINPSNQDITNAQAISGLRFGADAWTQQTRAAFRFNYLGTSASTTLANDGLNLVFFRNTQGSTPTVRATAYTWYIGSEIIEADIIFWDGSMTFVTGTMPCTDEIYLENTAIHEFGHALGLDHSSVTTATMYKSAPACSKTRLDLDPDDIAGVEALYPCSTNAHCNDALVCTTDVCKNTECVRTEIAGCCTANSQCGDGNACTTDTCVNNQCTHTNIAGCCTTNTQCGDGNACTTDKCVNNQCTHTNIADCCTANAQCGDGNACTTDKCVSNECTHTNIAGCCTTNGQCDDGDACTEDRCEANECVFTAVAGCTEPSDGGVEAGAESGAAAEGGVLGEPPKIDASLDATQVPESDGSSDSAGDVVSDATTATEANAEMPAEGVENGEGCACRTSAPRRSGWGAVLSLFATFGILARRRWRWVRDRNSATCAVGRGRGNPEGTE